MSNVSIDDYNVEENEDNEEANNLFIRFQPFSIRSDSNSNLYRVPVGSPSKSLSSSDQSIVDNNDESRLLIREKYEVGGENIDKDDISSNVGKPHMSFTQIIVLNMMYMGLNMLLLLLSVEVVPAQIEAIMGSNNKSIVLGITVALGAIITFIIGPMVGMHSDRLTSKWGRRRPIIVIAVSVLCASCILMVIISPPINTKSLDTNSTECQTSNLTQRRCQHIWVSLMNQNGQKVVNVTDQNITNRIYFYVPMYLIVISAYISTITPYNALIADKSRQDQRGFSSGAMGGMILLGNIFGAGLGLLLNPIGAIYTVSICLVILIFSVIVTVSQVTEIPLTIVQEPLSVKEQITSFYRPLKEHDFRWLFITRFLMQQGLTSLIGFLEYYVNDMLILPPCWSPYKAVSFLLLPLLISAALSSIISGIMSDRTGKRKLILIISSIMMSSMAFTMVFLRGKFAYYVTIFLAIIFGLALGGYQAVDFALLMDILPNEKEKSLMIAVWHQAMVLPQALAVPVSGLIVDLLERVNCQIGLGYIVLMLVIACYFILGGCFINKIRGAI